MQRIDPWTVLSLPRDAAMRDVKRRYAQLLKAHRPEDDPATFARIRWAYEICLAYAQQPVATEVAATVRDEVPVVATVDLIEQADVVEQTRPIEPAIEPLREPAPAAVVEVSLESMRLDRLVTLRKPAVVVDELLAHARTPEAFAAWMQACPELANFAARDAVEIELLARLAQEAPLLPAFALGALDAHFGWGDYDLGRRLAAGGLSPTVLERVLPALDNALIDARFEAHVAGDIPLYKPNPAGGWNSVIGNAKAEHALLRKLHAARDQRPRWWRALWPATVNSVNHLTYGYAMRYGNPAAQRLFGAPAIRFWQRAHGSAVPNLTRLVLLLVRGAAVFCVPLFFIFADFLGDQTPQASQSLRESLALVAALAIVYCCAVLLLSAVRWMNVVGMQRIGAWRLRLLDTVEPYLSPRIALRVLAAWNVPAVWFAAVHGTIPVLAIGVVAVGALLGIWPMIGTAVFTLLGSAVATESVDRYSAVQLAVAAANVPTVTWLIDRWAVRMTHWRRTRSVKRDYIVTGLLIFAALCLPFLSIGLTG